MQPKPHRPGGKKERKFQQSCPSAPVTMLWMTEGKCRTLWSPKTPKQVRPIATKGLDTRRCRCSSSEPG